MAHELLMDADGYLQVRLAGDMGKPDVDAYLKALAPFLQAATSNNPLHMMLDAAEVGMLSSYGRKNFIELNHDTRIGNVAVVRPTRVFRVLGSFIKKATKRDNIRFFASQAEAISWLGQNRERTPLIEDGQYG
jgi:hypothetical protein